MSAQPSPPPVQLSSIKANFVFSIELNVLFSRASSPFHSSLKILGKVVILGKKSSQFIIFWTVYFSTPLQYVLYPYETDEKWVSPCWEDNSPPDNST